MKETVEWYIGKYAVEHCFESPNVIALNERLSQFGYKVCFMAEYFLPDVDELKEVPCDYDLRVLRPVDFSQYYTLPVHKAGPSKYRKAAKHPAESVPDHS